MSILNPDRRVPTGHPAPRKETYECLYCGETEKDYNSPRCPNDGKHMVLKPA
jgi:hypothetical protein